MYTENKGPKNFPLVW